MPTVKDKDVPPGTDGDCPPGEIVDPNSRRDRANADASFGEVLAIHHSRDPSGDQARLRRAISLHWRLATWRKKHDLVLGAMPPKWRILWERRVAESPGDDAFSPRGRIGARMVREWHLAADRLGIE